MWAPADEGLVQLSLDAEVERTIDLGTRASALAAAGSTLWAIAARSGTLIRIGLDDLDVKRIEVGGPLDGVVAETEGAWAFRRADDVVVHVDPSAERVLGEVQLQGGCREMGLGQSEVVFAFTHRSTPRRLRTRGGHSDIGDGDGGGSRHSCTQTPLG